MKILTSTWMTLPISAVIYLAATVAFWKTPALPHLPRAPLAGPQGTLWDFKNPESDQLVAELKEEKQNLDKRSQQLDELAARLDAEKSEISAASQSVQKLQADFDKNVLRVKDDETANLKKLAKVYADMTPDGAAQILADLDDAAIAKIMVFMKDTDTAAILESFSKKGAAESKRAAALSERLRVASVHN